MNTVSPLVDMKLLIVFICLKTGCPTFSIAKSFIPKFVYETGQETKNERKNTAKEKKADHKVETTFCYFFYFFNTSRFIG